MAAPSPQWPVKATRPKPVCPKQMDARYSPYIINIISRLALLPNLGQLMIFTNKDLSFQTHDVVGGFPEQLVGIFSGVLRTDKVSEGLQLVGNHRAVGGTMRGPTAAELRRRSGDFVRSYPRPPDG
ncbi:disease resistance protein [Striga asiatica]|uniref:Disease resistance protein n=1 Tax=Striga asiatica TaxID=4170 RepID=A0A5A7QJT4_STRAF|nr:disease resistance protein [Striga asiatica]